MHNIAVQMVQQFIESYEDLENIVKQYRDDGEDDSFIIDVVIVALNRLNNENGE